MKAKLLRNTFLIVMVFTFMSVFLIDSKKAKAAVTGEESDAVIISYNILTTSTQPVTATNADGTKTRGEMLIDLIEEKQPDSMGLNEVTSSWKSYLVSNAINNNYTGNATYAIAGLISDSNYELKSGASEYSPILYRSDKYDVAVQGGSWFSDTPDVASKYTGVTDSNGNVLYSGMKFNRVYSYAVFYFKDTTNIAYIHMNVHFDHQSSDYINLKCAKQVGEKAEELKALYNCPIVISGDYNATEASNAYQYMANGENGFIDAKYLTDNYSTLSTCPGYGINYNANASNVIDHIVVSNGNIGVYQHDIIPSAYLSDHSCVYVKLSLNSVPFLDGITIDGTAIPNYTYSDTVLEANTVSSSVLLGVSADASYKVYADDVLIKAANASQITGDTTIALQNGDNNVELCVEDTNGVRTIYHLNVYKNYGNPVPIISEIYPNAEAGYKYFEVTNVGTSCFNTADYYYLWGNITNETNRTWDSLFPVMNANENVDVKPGDTVVFWFTYGGMFNNNTPTIKNFNDHYATYLTDEDIVISDPTVPFQGFLDEVVSKTYTMGSNINRGMRIADAKDDNGNAYSWSRVLQAGDACYNGPTVSVSSYNSISSSNITSDKLFKFKYSDGLLTTVSGIIITPFATPGLYDTRLGNEIRDAYSRIDAESLDAYSTVSVSEGCIGNTKTDSWAYYNNVNFGDAGSQTALFYGAVKGTNAAGTIQIYIDGSSDGSLTNATYIGSCTTTTTSTSDWETYALFSCRLNQMVTGIHNITLKFVPTLTYVVNLDYFEFGSSIECEKVSAFTDGININGNTASANLQYTSSATGMSNNITNGYNLIGNTVNGSTAKYLDVDFKDGGMTGITFNMALRTARCYGTVKIYLLNEDGTINRQIGYCTVTENNATDSGNGNYNTYKEFRGVITDSTVAGNQDILLKFVTLTYYVGNIDYFYLYK